MSLSTLTFAPTHEVALRGWPVNAKPAETAAPVPTPKPIDNAALMNTIIRPQARERWTALVTAGMTPDRVMEILRGAFSGYLVSQWELFDLMEDTWPVLGKCLNEIKEAVQTAPLAVNRFVRPGAKEPSPKAKAKAELLEAAMCSTRPNLARDENSWEDAIYDLCDAFGKCLSVQEILWEQGAYNGRPAWFPRAFKWVHPLHYGYPWQQIAENEDGAAAELLLSPSGRLDDWQPFPENKFIIGRFKSKTGTPLSGALLRKLAQFWIGANFSYDWALNLAQMFGIPIRWANYDHNAPNASKLLDDICQMLENLGSAGWGAFPAGTTLELKEAIQRAADNPQAFVMTIADTAASLLILGETLTSDSKQRGTQALGTVHMSVREQRIRYVASWVAKMMNYSFVPSLMLLNFGDNDEDPWLSTEEEEVEDAQKMAERDKTLLVDIGLPVSRKWLYDRHDVPMPEAGEDTFTAPKPQPPALPAPGQPGAPKLPPATQAKLGLPWHAKSANEQLAERMASDLTGIEAKWLGGVKPYLKALVDMAGDENTSDADWLATIEASAAQIPELGYLLNRDAIENALRGYMTAGLINGCARGVLNRRAGTKQGGGLAA